MPTSQLLKYARALDDPNFVWRVSAATSLEAGTRLLSGVAQTPAVKALNDWALANPMTTRPLILAFVATNAAVSAKVTIVNDRVDTEAVLDADIISVVRSAWPVIADQMFTGTPPGA